MGRFAGEMAELELRLKPLAGSRSSRPLGRPNARNSEILVVLTWLSGLGYGFELQINTGPVGGGLENRGMSPGRAQGLGSPA